MTTDEHPVERQTVTVTEAARILGIGRMLAYRLVRTGEIPSLRLGRRILIPREALMQMILHGKEKAQLEEEA